MEGEFKDIINTFLKYNAIWIAVGFVVLILIVLLILFLYNRKKKIVKEDKPLISESHDEWLISLGGEDNIVEANAKGSRLTIVLKDQNLLDEEKIKQLGVQSILKMSNKIVLVVKDSADDLLEKINKK